MSDRIHIKGLRVVTRVGVPDEERALPQSLAVNASITLRKSFKGFDDRIEHTLDYYRVSQRLREVAATGERHLIETLAEDLAATVLAFEGVSAVTSRWKSSSSPTATGSPWKSRGRANRADFVRSGPPPVA